MAISVVISFWLTSSFTSNLRLIALPLVFIMPGTILGIIISIYFIRRTKRSRAFIRQTVIEGTNTPADQLVRAIYSGSPGLSRYSSSLGAWLSIIMAENNYSGQTIRICPQSLAQTIEPFNVPFEPQPLNECASALLTDEQISTSTSSDSTWRQVKRYVILKGGWWFAAIIPASHYRVL